MDACILVIAPPRCGGNAMARIMSGYGDIALLEAGTRALEHKERISNLYHHRRSNPGLAMMGHSQKLIEIIEAIEAASIVSAKEFPIPPGQCSYPYLEFQEKALHTIFLYREPQKQAASYYNACAKDSCIVTDEEISLYLSKTPPEKLRYLDLRKCVDFAAKDPEEMSLVNFDDFGKNPMPLLERVNNALPERYRKRVGDLSDLLTWGDKPVYLPVENSSFTNTVIHSEGFNYQDTRPPSIEMLPNSWQEYVHSTSGRIYQQLESHPLNIRNQLMADQQKIIER